MSEVSNLRDVLKEHYLVTIICDHEAKTDTPQCVCSLVAFDSYPSVGQAVDAWIDHVIAQTEHDTRSQLTQSAQCLTQSAQFSPFEEMSETIPTFDRAAIEARFKAAINNDVQYPILQTVNDRV
jgi:hypothetical protein